MPTVTMLIGLPGCGKSTWRRATEEFLRQVVSSDDYIELIAAREGKTYDEVFADHIEDANNQSHRQFGYALFGQWDVVIDRTNLKPNVRKQFLRRIPEGYRKVAIVFAPPISQPEIVEWERRLAGRPGKTIPSEILGNMRRSFTVPHATEGFDEIIYVNTFKD